MHSLLGPLSRALGVAAVVFGGGQAACIGFPAHDQELPLAYWAQARGAQRAEVDAGRYIGISDLAAGTDPNGAPALYVFPERQRALLQLIPPSAPQGGEGEFGADAGTQRSSEARGFPGDAAGTGHARAPWGVRAEVRAVEGVPVDQDTESMAFLDQDHFVLGTETPWPNRTHDDVLVVRRVGHTAKVVAKWPFAYAPFGLHGQSNQGLEGLCVAGNVLLVAAETTGLRADGQRYAPLGLRHLAAPAPHFVPLRLALTSATGKISALTCRRQPSGAVEALAIERHYGTSRVLRFVVDPAAAPLTDLAPTLAFDLTDVMTRLPNFEGIAWLANGDVLLVTDNSMGFATGPTEVLLLPHNLLKKDD